MRRWLHLYVRAASVAVLTCLVTAAALVAITRAVRPPAQDRRAAPGTAWLSGEARGRAVLAAPGSQAGSIAVALGDPSTFDVASLTKFTAVFDRQTGGLALLDPALGTIKERKPRLAPRAEGTLVPAGTTAFVVDATAHTIRRVAGDGRIGDVTDVGPFTSVVATADGVLWVFDADTGSYASTDGTGQLTETRVVEPGTDVELTAVGNDAVLLDRDNHRLHWLSRGLTIAVEPGPGPLLLQQPDLSGFADCVGVVDGPAAACYRATGEPRRATLPASPTSDAQLLSGPGGLVVAIGGNPQVLSGPWGGELAEKVRQEPSPRRLTAWSTPSAILVDDPGSRYGFTTSGAAFTLLDKFSKRTVLITPDGPKIDLDADTQTVSKLPSTGPVKADPTKAQVNDTNPANEPPTPNDDRVRTRSGRSVNIDVLANDTDPDGDTLVVVGVEPASRGTVKTLNGSTVLYSPPADFVGTVSFDYRVADPGGLQGTATVTVDVVGADQNESPVPVDDTGETVAATPVTVPVLANDTDPEGDPLSIVAVGTPAHGSAAVTPEGAIRYEPTAGFLGGTDDFQYTVVDGFGGRASAHLRITIDSNLGKNRAPVAQDDRGTVVAGKRVRINVTQNDTDPDGDTLRVVSTGNVFGMTATIVGGQSIDLVPDLRTTGVVSVPYTIEDPDGLRASAQVILVVEAPTPNRAPQAIDDNVIVASEVQLVDVVANDVDPDGDQMTIVHFTQPTIGGTVTKGSATTLRFVPSQGFTSRTSFEYTISDPDGLTSTAKVNVEVVPPTGSGPVAVDDSATIYAGDTARVDVLANDSHPDGIPFSLAGPPTVRAGRAVVNVDNSISYTPPADQTGTFVITYTIRDFYNRTASAKLVVTVQARPVGGVPPPPPSPGNNRPPAAADDRALTSFQTPVTIDVLNNDSDPEGQPLTVGSVTAVTGGSPSIVNVPVTPTSGSPVQVRFQPDSTFTGLASFTYTAVDPTGGSASATVVVEVGQRLKVPPIGRDDLVTMAPATVVTVDPRVNDLDPDGSPAGLRVTGLTPAAGITATIEAGGTAVRITSAGGGTYQLGYQVTDPDGLTGTATVTVTVTGAVNRPPVAVNDAVSTGSGTPITIDVLANDTDPDSPSIVLRSVTQPPSGGSAAISGAAVLFTPAAGFDGVVTFSYTIADTAGLTATATVTVTVTACTALPPVLADDSTSTDFNTARAIDLYANDTRTGPTLVLGRPSSGIVALLTGPGAGPGVVVYTPVPGFSGRATFTYTVTSVCGQSVTATATVTVNPANRPPVAGADSASTSKNTPVTINVLANDTDPDGDALSIVQWSSVVGGTVSRSGNQLIFTPTPGSTAPGSFVYEISDPGGLRDSAAVSITVNPPSNRPPTANDDSANTTFGVPVDIDVLANDSDPDGDPLTISAIGVVSPPAAGVAVLGGTLARPLIRFTPLLFVGPATFTYTITDGQGGFATATVTVSPTANRPPVAKPDSANTTVGSVAVIDVLANDTDPDGNPLNIASVGVVSPPGAGIVAVAAGKVNFTATAEGTATFTYTVADPSGATDIGTVTVVVGPAPNQNPVAVDDTATLTTPDTFVAVNVLANDSDPDGDVLRIVTSPPPAPNPDTGVGTVTVVGTDIIFTILPGFTGSATVTIPYTVSDGRGGTANATLTISVTM